LATPNTTATRPSRLKDIGSPEGKMLTSVETQLATY
jgi:hypothetical protein